MIIREEFEILRGEPIAVNEIAPADVPCIETSDVEKLCRNPVVSVHMMTYNHAKYISRAIEGVVMQDADFEYELVIGEDCSKDETRKICFEYQKRYPDKIRVLWHHENVHNRGGNGARIHAHCRGEFVAFCEGDDYWTDPKKLQKQVDVMRRHPSVGLCFCRAEIHQERSGNKYKWGELNVFDRGVIPGRKFFLYHIFGSNPCKWPEQEAGFIMTSTVLVRRSILMDARRLYEIFKWRLRLGDTTNWLGVSSLSDVYYLPEFVSVYYQHPSGIMGSSPYAVSFDAYFVRMYYCYKVLQTDFSELPTIFRKRFLISLFEIHISSLNTRSICALLKKARRFTVMRAVFRGYLAIPLYLYLLLPCFPIVSRRLILMLWYRVFKLSFVSNGIAKEYSVF